MGKLNPKQVENLTEPGTYEDGDGLRLEVKPSGSKSWTLRFQLAGRRREMGLGSFPEVSLKKARQDASAKRTQLSDGIDPLDARDIERAAQREAQRASEAQLSLHIRLVLGHGYEKQPCVLQKRDRAWIWWKILEPYGRVCDYKINKAST